jgi:hypothetical protein
MSTDAVTPLRHRMIEDMNARKLCAGTQRRRGATFTVASGCCVSQSLPRHHRDGGYPPVFSCTWPRPV